jgi:hypothetical protein
MPPLTASALSGAVKQDKATARARGSFVMRRVLLKRWRVSRGLIGLFGLDSFEDWQE